MFTAYIAKEGSWWIGWVQGVAGVNCMEKTKTKLLASLRETLPEMLEVNPEVYIDNEPEPHFKTTTIQI
ncbi:type II toxin-antitoxin system HicB family antitoxin [Candidatus Poribacteria bacterium]|nr:type II toxin-antitoxin system HicB family antitoxin [Candidatus Poribacteria bacterium]